MALGLITGEPEKRPCIRCGLIVGHQRITYRSKRFRGQAVLWTAGPHRAPCGVACGIGHPSECSTCSTTKGET